MSDASDFFDMNRAPIRIGTLRLKVRDLEGISAFYQAVLGLKVIEAGARSVTLGTGSKPLLTLEGDQKLAPRDPRQPGLFHSAFLLPSRAELARWLTHVAEQRVPLQGASDHNVSEAIYLADPEGNGIEVYADTPLARWRGAGGEVHMTTEPLDLEKLLKAGAGSRWGGFPEDGMIGHLHLQVGDTALADRFYRDVLGLEITTRYPGASFYGSGGYHHHLAGNVWHSRRAQPQEEETAGLDGFSLLLRDADEREAILVRAEGRGIAVDRRPEGAVLHDPWGFAITLN